VSSPTTCLFSHPTTALELTCHPSRACIPQKTPTVSALTAVLEWASDVLLSAVTVGEKPKQKAGRKRKVSVRVRACMYVYVCVCVCVLARAHVYLIVREHAHTGWRVRVLNVRACVFPTKVLAQLRPCIVSRSPYFVPRCFSPPKSCRSTRDRSRPRSRPPPLTLAASYVWS